MVTVNNAQSHNSIRLMGACRCVPVSTTCKQQLWGNRLIDHVAVSSPDYHCMSICGVQIKGQMMRMPDYDRNSMLNNCGSNTDVDLVGRLGGRYYRSPRL